MLFSSWGYLLFLALVLAVHRALPGARPRLWFLGLSGLAFYAMWRWEFLALLLFSTVLDYACGLGLARRPDDPRARRLWVLASLIGNLGMLVAFKYSGFLWDNLRGLAGLFGADWPSFQEAGIEVVLPLGISFYTFQTMSYTLDVARGVAPACRSFPTYLAYVGYFPQLIAGPILRPNDLVPQLEQQRLPGADEVVAGLSRILVGLFKKIVLADSIAPLVDQAFAADPAGLSAWEVWTGTCLFGFQIYFDFAGYSDIALGSARAMGFTFPENFDWPYLARSPREFWSRWHITLSSWIRDYLYLPLAGDRFRTTSQGGIGVAAEARPDGSRHVALLLTWFIMGLWHGAAWTFAAWGVWHALLILLYRVVPPLRALPERRPVLAWSLHLPLAMAGWIWFRAQGLPDALGRFARLLDPRAYLEPGVTLPLGSGTIALLLLAGLLAARGVEQGLLRRPLPPALHQSGVVLLHALMVAAVLTCLRAVQQFIYFQF